MSTLTADNRQRAAGSESLALAVLLDIPRLLCAADGTQYNYPIPDGALIFPDRIIGRRGDDFEPHLPNGKSGFQFNDAFYERIEASYDPLWYPARFYIDHPLLPDHPSSTPPCGPCQGIILRVRYDRAAGNLHADILVTDCYACSCIVNGQLPDVSMEYFDSSFTRDGKGLFYGLYESYLAGVAGLGVIPPAIPCGPWPAPVSYCKAEMELPPIPYVNPIAAQHVALAAQKSLPPQEASMPTPTTEAGGQGASLSPPPMTPEAFLAMQAENDQLRSQLGQARQQTGSIETAAAQALRAENDNLRRELADNTKYIRGAQLNDIVAAQYKAGRLTVAAESDFRAAASLALELDAQAAADPAPRAAALACAQASVAGAPNSEKVTAAGSFLDLVLALASHLPGHPTGAQAGPDRVQTREGEGGAVTVTASDEKAAAASNGKLTAAECAHVRVHGKLPTAAATTEGGAQ